MYIKLILKQLGFTDFFEAKNGDEAVEMYERHRPDITMMDVNMPVKEGMEALEEIMVIDAEAVVIMTTSVASRQAVERSAELGASHYIRKDTPRDEVSNIIRRLIEEIWECTID
jgi:two-component system chemotaxis response regulator CheY